MTDIFYTTITEVFFCQTLPGHLCDLFILTFKFFSSYRSSPPGTTFLSVLIQFLASNDRDTRITICLRSDCRRACLDMKYPVQFTRISWPETIDQHSFLKLIIVQMNLGTFIQNFFQIITGKMWIDLLCRIKVPEYPIKDNVLCFQRKLDRKSTRLNSSHKVQSRMPSSA